jgi:curved DNA-binding protein CbpA
MSGELPFSGSIRETRLPAILRELQRRQLTGTLNFRRNDLDKALYLKDGDIIFASSRYSDDRLGEVLLKAGKITFAQYESSVELLKRSRKRQGTILVEQGILTAAELFAAVTQQVKEIVLSLFTWIDGEYFISPGSLPLEELITLRMSTANLILEGIRRISDWTRLAGELPPFSERLRLTTDPRNLFQLMSIDPRETSLVDRINGQTIRDLLSSTPLPPFDALKFIYFLLSVGIAEVATSAPGHEPTEEEDEKEPATERIIVEEIKGRIFEQAPGPPMSLQEVQMAYQRMQSQNHYEILGITPQASREEVKRSYFRLAKAYHPDRHFEEGMQEIKKELEELFSRITEAYDTLTTPAKRSAYDSILSGKLQAAVPARPLKPEEQAHRYFCQGKEAFEGKDFNKAVYFFESAASINPKNHIFLGNLGQALLCLSGQVHRAEEALRKAVTLEPDKLEYYIDLARIYEEGGLVRRAIKECEEAIKRDPQNPILKKQIHRLKTKG